jgi:hypothetical protein
LTQRSIEEAARIAQISERTLYRWLKDSRFDGAYREARRLAFQQSVSRLQQASSACVTTLLKLAVDATTPPAVRARSAYFVLHLGTRALEVDDIDHRVCELERAAAQPTDD